MKILSDEEVQRLSDLNKGGDVNARWELTHSQRHWLVKQARQHKLPRGVDFEDVVSGLTLELFSAMKNYDVKAGRLSTFCRVVFARRYQRVVNRLTATELPAGNADREALGEDEALADLRDVIDESTSVSAAGLMACRMKLDHMSDQAILTKLSLNYPSNTFDHLQVSGLRTVKRLIDTTIETLRKEMD